MKKYKIWSNHSWDRTSVKTFDTLTEAVNHYDMLYHEHEKNESFHEWNNGKGFTVEDLTVELVTEESDDTQFFTDEEAIWAYKIENRPLIYLASPYTHDDPKVVEERFQKVAKKAAELTNQGMIIFSPIAMAHPMAIYGKLPGDWTFWEKFDKAYLSCCNKLIIYRLDGWEISKGISEEIKIAQEINIPIEYID